MDIKEINKTITVLENGNTSFDSCLKLASLYNVRDHIQYGEHDKTKKELNDILPQYAMYKVTKRKFQLNELTEHAVKHAIKDVCKEIFEFMQMLYSGTDMEEERIAIEELIKDLENIIH